MKPQRLSQELCQAYLLYQVLGGGGGGIFSTGVSVWRKRVRRKGMQGKLEAQLQGGEGQGGAGH